MNYKIITTLLAVLLVFNLGLTYKQIQNNQTNQQKLQNLSNQINSNQKTIENLNSTEFVKEKQRQIEINNKCKDLNESTGKVANLLEDQITRLSNKSVEQTCNS